MVKKLLFIALGCFIVGTVLMVVFQICPPSGPWPMPPWCGTGSKPAMFDFAKLFGQSTSKTETPATAYDLVAAKYPGSRSMFVFPPACNIIPDKIAQTVCETWKRGEVIFWQEEACIALPFASGNKACQDERAALKKIGLEKIKQLRQENPDWWKKPYLNTYVYGDVRLHTEELRPTASIWGGGSWDGWRDDEIFMTHAVGVLKIPSHSFGYIGGNDLDFMRNRLIKDEGIIITGPKDLQNPEVVKIKNDLDYLETHSSIFKKLSPALAKDFDGKQIVVGAMGKVSYVVMDPAAPAFHDYLISYGQWQVDAGAEGLFIDDLAGHNPSDSFGDDSLAHFGAWLLANAPQVAAKYGITDAASFNYRDFLKKQGYTKAVIDETTGTKIGASERWRTIPLMVEFRHYLIERNQQSLISVIGAVREYAKSKGRPDFIFTGNSGELSPAVAFAVPLLDYLTFEHGYAQSENPMNWKSVAPLTKLANAKERPANNQLVVTQWPLYTKLAPALRYDLLRLMTMESVSAHGANHYVRYSALDPRQTSVDEQTVYMALEDRKDLAEMAKAFGFLRVYHNQYRDIADSNAQVAILYDNDEVVREWRDDLRSNYQYAVEDAARALFAKNVEFDVVDWKQLAAGKYTKVILPPFKTISSENAAVLQKLKQQGATVLATGAVPAGTEASVVGLAQAVVTVAKAVSVLALPQGVQSLSYRDSKGDLLINLMNYNYDSAGFKEKKNIAIDPAFFGQAKKITFASIEHPEAVELNVAHPVVPSLTTYGLLIISK